MVSDRTAAKIRGIPLAMLRKESAKLFEAARAHIPGGVSSSTRALDPALVFTRASGSKIYDADGNGYIDYHAAFGPILLGHCHPRVNARVFETVSRVDLIGAGTLDLEAELAARLVEHIPSAERVLLCTTGSEATYNAVRLARAVTGKTKLVKFQGCYHGWHDYLCMNVITPREKLGTYDLGSAGMLEDAVRHTIVLDFNRIDQVEATLRREGESIAAVILEPIPHNIGCVLPRQEFLDGLRELTRRHDVILIFDEVITGFRHGIGGFQAHCGVTPDLTTFGKAIANGWPCSALVGRKDLMDRFQTAGGDVFFAGTFNGHPAGVAAALQVIEELRDGSVHARLFAEGERVARELGRLIERAGVRAHVSAFGSVFAIYFMEGPVENYTDLLRNDREADLRFRRGMIERGIFTLPMALKRNHLSASHSEEDIAATLQAASDVLTRIAALPAATTHR